MQNFKSFLLAFITGLIVFGICAVLLVRFGLQTMLGENGEDFNDTPFSQTEESEIVS